jgi:hypothetical protein
VAPGKAVTVNPQILPPDAPGTYTLTLDLVREQIAWFSDQNPDSAKDWAVEVISPD